MCSPHKERSCYWNIFWLDIYLTYHFYLVPVIYYVYLAKTVFLFTSIRYPNQFYDKQRKRFLHGDLCVLYVMLWNISFPGWRFSTFSGCSKKTWWPLVNACLMSQYQENVIRFNFLANALKHCYHYLGNLSQTRSSSVLEDPYFFLQNSHAKMNLDDQRKILNPRSANHSEKHSNLLYFTLSSQYLLIVNKFLLETISYNG